MYNLSIEVDNQNVSSGNVEVEGTDFYGCGCRANGQCAGVLGYWENDVLTVLLSDEGCGSSEGQILNEGGIYDFEEVGSGTLNGDNSFGLSGNGVQAYVTYLIHEGDDVTVSDRQSINATVRFVPIVEEIVPEEGQGTDLAAEEEEGLQEEDVKGDGAAAAEQVPSLGAEEEGEEQQLESASTDERTADKAEDEGLAEGRDGEAVLQDMPSGGVHNADQVDLEEGEEEAEEHPLAEVLLDGENVDVSQITRPEVPAGATLTEKMETELEVSGPEAEVLEVQENARNQEDGGAEEEGEEQQLESASTDERTADKAEEDVEDGGFWSARIGHLS